MQTRIWFSDLRDGKVIRRAIKTAMVVGTALIAITQGAALIEGEFTSRMAWQIPLTVMVPFTVSLMTSATVVGSARRANSAAHERLRNRLETINKFPNLNPNPVLRISLDQSLVYANDASKSLVDSLGVREGEPISESLFEQLNNAANQEPARSVEVEAGNQTYSLLPVLYDDQEFLNVYGTDITASKVLNKFPDLNPNPVMKLSNDGVLDYANDAAAPVVEAIGVAAGQQLPGELIQQIEDVCNGKAEEPLTVSGGGRTYALSPVYTPEFEITNIYGQDITARIAMNKFPDQNPNPVLRVSGDGVMEYANPASELVLKAIGTDVGSPLPKEFFEQISSISESGSSESIEVSTDGRTFSLLVVGVFEFGFINLYGTEITASIELEKAHKDNELLLLNILPSSIADRLKSGEGLIADRFEDMSVLFADVVGFTEMSQQMTPNELVKMLNHVFSLFDSVADDFHLEKIKTIGDAYMVAGGLGTDGTNHAENIADMGIEMLRLLDEYREESGVDIKIRIGMHSGPAVAGVVGLKKFIYDVWGDTVNTASRMESHGVPNRIQMLESTKEKLAKLYDFEERGEVDIKGIGVRTTFLLKHKLNGSNSANGAS